MRQVLAPTTRGQERSPPVADRDWRAWRVTLSQIRPSLLRAPLGLDTEGSSTHDGRQEWVVDPGSSPEDDCTLLEGPLLSWHDG